MVATTSGSRRYESDMVRGWPGPGRRSALLRSSVTWAPTTGTSQRIRIVDATLACIASQGLSKTILDDIAEAAGLSRATVYRAFPGGRDAIFAAAVETELARLFSHLAVCTWGRPATSKRCWWSGSSRRPGRGSWRNRAIGYLLEHEPGVLLLPHVLRPDEARLAVASSFAAPFLARWLEPDQAARAAEWAVRITFSYLGEARLDRPDRPRRRRPPGRAVSSCPGVLALRAAADDRPTRPIGKPWRTHRQ